MKPKKIINISALIGVMLFARPEYSVELRSIADAATFEPREDIGRSSQLVWIKYRETPVNVADPRFEYLDTSRSSFITAAWYDSSSSYMVTGLRGTYYHYCRMPKNAWNAFRAADSLGRHYNAFIKGNFDCRLGGVPPY
jgi:hypothetical protein